MALRRANVRVEERRGLFGALRAVRLWYGGTAHFAVDRRAWQRLNAGGEPLLAGSAGGRRLWATADGCYWADPELEAEAVALLVWDRGRRQAVRLDRLRKIRAADADAGAARRERIPDEVRAAVWLRDGGRCVRCGAEADLQFDHVIPVARGGGSAEPNIQVLCGTCNRAKGDAIV